MIPDYQTLMRPVLQAASGGEVRVGDVVERLSDEFGLTTDERAELLSSGKQTVFANRVHWSKTYLKQAGLLEYTRRGHFTITERGRAALAGSASIDNSFLDRFDDFRDFRSRTNESIPSNGSATADAQAESPEDQLRTAHRRIAASLSNDLLERVRNAPPAFFENLIVSVLIKMGYGGTSQDAGRAIGQSGDDGVDGVIDQDPLGVDQIYVQAKRYAEGRGVGAAAIRDFFGALSLKKAHKGIFVTTSDFTASARETAAGLGSRIVLIDGQRLADLMIRYDVGCRTEEVFELKRVDEDFFESL